MVHSALTRSIPTEQAEGPVVAFPDPDMCAFELDILRTMNGEDIPGMVAGAAMWSAAAWLKGRGYAEGHYQISEKGVAYLAALTEATPTPTQAQDGYGAARSEAECTRENPNV